MADGPETTFPAGWYADPSDSSRWRYWDGQEWTTDVLEARTPAPRGRLAVIRAWLWVAGFLFLLAIPAFYLIARQIQKDAASNASQHWVQAVHAKDAERACNYLTPDFRRRVEAGPAGCDSLIASYGEDLGDVYAFYESEAGGYFHGHLPLTSVLGADHARVSVDEFGYDISMRKVGGRWLVDGLPRK
ncbi:MAG: hypothetical protein QOG63_1297 [Thermoleophilaceae bacterium]|jgi:hypothetical protein|nr:hypothetical protein [Thermoleophilaceae bacterium]